jgi:hypothetical protein
MKTIHKLVTSGIALLCVTAAAQTVPSALADAGNGPQPYIQQAVTLDQTPPGASVSQVRIVRLSQVAGQVYLDRGTEQRFEQAFVNLPIVAQSSLLTRDGLAEVEFEDNSSLRLTPHSLVEFPMLGRDAAGTTTTGVRARGGTLYASLAGGHNSSQTAGTFKISAGGETIELAPGTHLRMDLNQPTARMIVYQGTATVSGAWGSMAVAKHRAVSFDIAASAAPVFLRADTEGAFDSWDRTAVDYHKVRAANAASFAGSPYTYGLSDLHFYGSFADIGGCGMMWRPYLANAAWDPYGSGVWTWYPGQGYSWVSLYPWGWTPFHSGEWDYCPTGGWGWRPKGNWNGLSNHPHLPVKSPIRKWPVAPPSPRPGQPTVIAVNLKSMQHSEIVEDGKFVLRGGSAGLGVPRGVVSNLGKISERAEARGTAVAWLSERQMQAGLIAPARSSGAGGSGASGSSFVRYSGTQSAIANASSASRSGSAASTASPASNIFVSSGSSVSMPSASVGSSSAASASGAAHH